MADRTIYVPELLEFHPCDTPRGMEYYNLEILTPDQQKRLNRHKTETIRDNQKYFFKNPEIRGIIQLVIRKLLLERPSHNIESFIGRYFSEEWQTIAEEVKKYVDSLPGKPKPEQRKISIKEERHVTLDDQRFDVTSDQFSIGSEESLTKHIVKEIIEEIIERVHEHCQKRVRTSDDVDIIDDRMQTTKESLEDDDEFYFDLGLDFELDFSTYHEDEDKEKLF